MKTGTRPGIEPIVSARGIVNQFATQSIHDDIDLDILPGEIIGIAGGSGSGKTILLKTLIGLHRPNAGEVRIGGQPVESIDDAEKAFLMGVLFQQGALFSSLTVAQNVMVPMREHTDLQPQNLETIAALKLELAGLSTDTGLKYPSQLSGGMVKRAALARALALDPRILFLDEPTSDLDALTAGGIDELILRLNQNLGVTVVIITHDLTTLFTICTRIAVLIDQKIVVNTLDQLMRSEQPWIHDFFHGPRARGAMNAKRKAMETDKHYFLVGLFIIGVSVAAALAAVWLTRSGERDDVLYRIHFAESVSGLALGDTVKFQGVDVGTVEAIAIEPNDPSRVRVDVKLHKGTPVKTDTRASLELKGITGGVFVQLKGSSPEAQSLLEVTAQNEVPEIPAVKSSLSNVLDELPAMIRKMSGLADKASKVVSDAGEITTEVKDNPRVLLFGKKKEPEPDKQK